MSLDKLESKIRKTTEEELSKVTGDGKARLERIEADIKAEADGEYERVFADGKRVVQRKVDGILSNARVLARDIIESRKRELVDEVFKRVGEKILTLPDREKKRLLERMLAEAKEGIEHPRVFVDSSCVKYIRGVKKDLGDFGFIVTDEEETVRVDCTLGNVLSRLKPVLEPDIGKILFKPQK